jgi:hypothetical protein
VRRRFLVATFSDAQDLLNAVHTVTTENLRIRRTPHNSVPMSGGRLQLTYTRHCKDIWISPPPPLTEAPDEHDAISSRYCVWPGSVGRC